MTFSFLSFLSVSLLLQASVFMPNSESKITKSAVELRSFAFEPDVIIENYNQEKGLPIDALTSVYWGKDGWLYCTTFDGLTRFNGFKFEVYNTTNDTGFVSDKIYHQLHTNTFGVWLLDEDHELLQWSKEQSTRIGREQGLPNIMVHDLQEDKNGSIWLGTEYGIFKKNGEQPFKQFNRDLRLVVWNLHPIDPYSALAMTNQGLYLVTDLQLINLLPVDEPILSNDKRVRFFESSTGEFFIGTSGGFAHFSASKELIFKKEMNTTVYHLQQIHPDSSRFLIRTMGRFYTYDAQTHQVNVLNSVPIQGGNFKFNDLYWHNELLYVGDSQLYHKNRIIFQTPNNSYIQNVVQDNSGALWVATDGEGLFKIRYSDFQTLDFRDATINLNSYSIQKNGPNQVLFTTMRNGLLEWNGSQLSQHIINIRNTEERSDARMITSGIENQFYVSFWGDGIWTYNNAKWNRFLPNNEIIFDRNNVTDLVYEDGKQKVWIGNLVGFFSYDFNKQELQEIKDSLGFPITKVRAIQRIHLDTLLIGTTGSGVYKINTVNGFSYQLNTQYTGQYIRDISVLNDTIWFGTEDKGLVRFVTTAEPKEQFRTFHYPEIKKDWAVHKLLKDRFGFWWFTNNQGLYRVKKKELDLFLDGKLVQTKVDYFTEKDGLPTREFNGGTLNAGIADEKGHFWLPSIRGLIHVKPENFLVYDSLPPKLMLTQLKTNKRIINLTKLTSPVQLHQDERTLRFEYELLHFSRNEPISLSYTLDTTAGNWYQIKPHDEIQLLNLAKGEHSITLKVNHQFSTAPVIAALDFIIEPYFYESPMFYGTLVVSSFFILGIFYRVATKKQKQTEENLISDLNYNHQRLQQQEEINEQVQQLIEKKQVELDLLYEEKNNQLIQFSHDIRTPLQLIRGPVELLLNEINKGTIDLIKLEKNKKLIEKYYVELVEYSDNLVKKIQEHSLTQTLAQSEKPTESVQLLTPEQATEKPETKENSPFKEDLSETKTKLLIVDDIDDIRDYLQFALEADYHIQTATNGKEALQIVQKSPPHLILCDIMMPEMDGFEFAQNFYSQPEHASIPLIYLTAKDSEEDRFMGLQAGAVAYLTKPVQTNVLKAQINALIKREMHIQHELPKQNISSEFMKRMNELIYRHLGNTELSLDTLAEAMHMSKSTLYRKWKDETDETLANYILSIRLQEVLKLVKDQDISFSEASALCGFNNASYFSRAFKKVYGCTPSEYKEKIN